jgi:6-phosphofructokinase
LGRDLEAMETYEDVVILETAGRDAGWIPAATALLKESDEAPHLIYIPEIAFDETSFLNAVQQVHSRLGRVFVVAGEGMHRANGELIAQSRMQADSMGRNVYALSEGAGMALAHLIQQKLSLQVRVIRPGLIARSQSTCVSEPDHIRASLVGFDADKTFLRGTSDCMISLQGLETRAVALSEISGKTRYLPDSFMNETGTMISPAFYQYARPFIGAIASIARLSIETVAKHLPFRKV